MTVVTMRRPSLIVSVCHVTVLSLLGDLSGSEDEEELVEGRRADARERTAVCEVVGGGVGVLGFLVRDLGERELTRCLGGGLVAGLEVRGGEREVVGKYFRGLVRRVTEDLFLEVVVVVDLRGLVRRDLFSGFPRGKTGTRFFGLDLREPAREESEPRCSACREIWECPRSRKGD